MESWISFRRSLSLGLVAWIPGRRTVACAGVLAGFLVTCELAGRVLGLHTPVLYKTTAYGYRVQPQQDIRRFGNRIYYDVYGLRSEGISVLPAPGVLRVLCLGDSITNGGAITDQDDTYPAQLQRLMTAGGRRVEVVNASAPGWAVANESGWLRENGTFGAHVVVLTIGTTDLFQEEALADIVDRHPSFPSQAPMLAIEELWLRYLMPRILRQSSTDPGAERLLRPAAQATAAAASAVSRVITIAADVRLHDAIPVVLFVEQPENVEPADAVTLKAKAGLSEALRTEQVAFASTREAVRESGGQDLFRDMLHPNTRGNGVLAQVAAGLLEDIPDTRK